MPDQIRKFLPAIISRIKIMSNLNIVERRLPQDGRASIKAGNQKMDLRISVMPTPYGESVVIRILPTSMLLRLEDLGLGEAHRKLLHDLILKPYGIIFVTGPTGAGKSTTLYACLATINTPERKIITLEDPIEYEIEGITQIQVLPQIGLTFSQGLRHIVRQDPDVIMVGEIRDRETADIAIRAALTGHFVYSTLHTNDAPSAIPRLTDMGVENYLITSSLVSVLAQRLVRVICSDCKTRGGTTMTPDGENIPYYRGTGCENCFGTGFHGRVGIFELMELNEEIRAMIMRNEDATKITTSARRSGMRNLREDGWLKIRTGVTTPEEVTRVTQEF